MKLNFVDVFSGAGGLSCGLEMAGMHCLLGIENNPYAMQTFIRNHKNAQGYAGSVHDVGKKEIDELIGGKKVHVVVGGPPCQGFSTVGIGDPEDNRNHLFLHFIKIVKITKPFFVVMENVTGLLARKNENTLKSIFKCLNELGYDVNVQIMSAQDYGVPERRRRTIILGSCLGKRPLFPGPTHGISGRGKFRALVTVAEAFSDLRDRVGDVHNHDIESAMPVSKMDIKRLAYIPEGKGIRYERDERAYFPPALRLGLNWKELPEGRLRQTKYQRLDGNRPAPTIMTHRCTYYHPVDNRYLTVREAARLQSFPNDFIFEGSLTSQWCQIGNAVPPLLGKAIGKSLIRQHREAKWGGKKRQKLGDFEVDAIRGQAFLYREPSSQVLES